MDWSLTGFMREIGAAKRVVLVLSDAYFKSSYCMFELLEIDKNRDFERRVQPIVLEDAQIYDPKVQVGYVNFWGGNKQELESELKNSDLAATAPIVERLQLYAEYHRNIARLLQKLADSNALTPAIHKSSDFSQLIERLQSSDGQPLAGDVATTPPSITRNRKPDSLFMQELAKDLHRHLEKLPESAKTDLTALLDLTKPDSNNARAWQDDPSLPITRVLAPATRRFLADEQPDSKVFKAYWAQAKKLLGCLCLYAVKEKVVEELERTNALGRLHFDLAVTTQCSVEVVQARFLQVPASFAETPGISDPPGSHGIDPKLAFDESGWNGSAALDALLRIIWNNMFTGESLPRTDYALSKDSRKLERLDATIQLRLEGEGEHHYLSVELPPGFDIQASLFKSLNTCLPNLGFVFFRPDAVPAETALRNESRMVAAIQEFLMIPHRIREAV